MKDFRGLEISVGDCVGFICIEGYDINIIKDRIRSIENRRACFENSSTSTLAMDGRFNKIVKIEDRKAPKNAATDAVGQPVSLGDKVVFKGKVVLGTSCRGFVNGGEVTKITQSYIYTRDPETGTETKRKSSNVVVVEFSGNEPVVFLQKKLSSKEAFLAKHDNSKPYGWVCYSVTVCPPMVHTNVLSVGMTKEEAEANAVKKYGESIHCATANEMCPIYYEMVTEAAYIKLKTAKTLKRFSSDESDGVEVLCYDED